MYSKTQGLKLEKERVVDCYITMPECKSRCRGNVRWTTKDDEHYSWGIIFTELSPFEKDPLRAAINTLLY